jgi:hypothetical protein
MSVWSSTAQHTPLFNALACGANLALSSTSSLSTTYFPAGLIPTGKTLRHTIPVLAFETENP